MFLVGMSTGLSLSTALGAAVEVTPRWSQLLRAWRNPRPQVGDTWIHDRLGRVVVVLGRSWERRVWTVTDSEGRPWHLRGYDFRWHARKVVVTLQDVPPPEPEPAPEREPESEPAPSMAWSPALAEADMKKLALGFAHGPRVPTFDDPAVQTDYKHKYRHRAVYFNDGGRVHRYSQVGSIWYSIDGHRVGQLENQALQAAFVRRDLHA